MIYFVSFFIVLLISAYSEYILFNDNKKSIKNNYMIGSGYVSKKIFLVYLFFVIFTILWLVGALRYNVGVDYVVYSYSQIPRVLSGDFSAVEPLASLIFIVGAKMGSYQYIFAIIQFLIIFFTVKAIYDSSVNYTFSFLLLFLTGFFNSSLNLMRQSIAISIFLFSIKYIFDRKFIKYLFWIVVAFLFHKTAIIYLPVYFLYKYKYSKKRLGFITLIIILSSFVFGKILVFVTSYFNVYTNYWGQTEMQDRINNRSSGTYWFLNLIIFFFMIFLYEQAKRNGFQQLKELGFYIYIQLICIAIMVFSYVTYVPNFDRLLTMFSYVQILSLPLFFSVKMNKVLKLLLIAVVIISYVIAFYLIFIQKNIGGTFPYNSIFK